MALVEGDPPSGPADFNGIAPERDRTQRGGLAKGLCSYLRSVRIGGRAYPAWIIEGQRYEGVLTLDRLAGLSRLPERGR